MYRHNKVTLQWLTCLFWQRNSHTHTTPKHPPYTVLVVYHYLSFIVRTIWVCQCALNEYPERNLSLPFSINNPMNSRQDTVNPPTPTHPPLKELASLKHTPSNIQKRSKWSPKMKDFVLKCPHWLYTGLRNLALGVIWLVGSGTKHLQT